MPRYTEHDITLASFAQIDREIGPHHFSPAEYAVVRRIIHTTADFEFAELVQFSGLPIQAATQAFTAGCSIVTDVSMVAAGIKTVVQRTWQSPVAVAVQRVPSLPPADPTRAQPQDQTRSAQGMRLCAHDDSNAIFVVGNAPTALLALCDEITQGRCRPALVIGAPVGFINVIESKQMLASLAVPHIVITGRKGGSAVAAAILNALLILAWETKV
ncbi:MAG: precorrin-8X methylmutase [Cyanobacteria bacterium J06632_3]